MRQIRRILGASGATVLAASMVFGAGTVAPVHAATHSAAAAATTATETPNAVPAGGQITVSGVGFAPHEPVAVLVSPQKQRLMDITADANGLVPATKVPLNAATFTPGPHTLILYGSSSHREALVHFTITAANPMLRVSSTTANRGGVVTVTGSGFRPGETVDLTVSGVSGIAATATANANGMLPATGISIPYSLTPGSYTITATGTASKRMSKAAITVAKLTPSIAISTPSAAPGSTETVTGKNFGAKEQVTLSLDGQALSTTPSVITTSNGSFTATFKVPTSILRGTNTISAIGNQSRVSSITTFSGILKRAPEFYFAGGINSTKTNSYLSLLNANKQPASVRLTFYFENGAAYTRLVTVNADSEKRVPVANLGFLPVGTFGLVVKADRQISAQLSVVRPSTKGTPAKDGATFLGNTSLGTQWYLAAGSTKGMSHEQLSILNPSSTTPASVQLQLLTAVGTSSKTVTVDVPVHSNKVIDVNTLLPNQSVSIVANSSQPVVVERTMTFGPNGQAMTMRAGSNKAATNWLFSDGTTENNVQTVLSILNPGASSATVTASFSRENGFSLGSHSVVVPARSRVNLTLNGLVQGGGIAINVTSNQAVVVERSETIGMRSMATAGSVVFGRNGAATTWTFPGGKTAVGYNEVLDLYNPSSATAQITVTFYDSNGKMVTRKVSMTPMERLIIPVNTLGLSAYHGAVLQSTNGQGFIAEQGTSTHDSHALNSTQGLAQ